MSSGAICVACRHTIDAVARICPYCGANPATGEKIDTEAILREEFKGRSMTASESVLEYARHRQGIVVAIGLAVAFLILAGLHQFATMRNNTAVASGPAVPLSDVADLSDQPRETQQLPMPPLNFQYDGRPQVMRTFIVEPGAVAPPPATATAPPPAAPPATPPHH
jgi:RNA polymerase subunit RPABC4/transcription elongation factor Spt4